MEINPKTKSNIFNSPAFLLGLGFLFNLFCQMRWNVQVLAWICLIPFMRYIRLGYSKKILTPILFLSMFLSFTRIVSFPWQLSISLMSGMQSTLVYLIVLFLWDFTRKKKGEIIGIFFLPAITVSIEWIISQTSPLGVWGMFANSQMENLPLIQIASITGAFGISFLLIWSNSLIEAIIHWAPVNADEKKMIWKKVVPGYLVILIAVYSWGSYRLFSSNVNSTVRMAAISTKFELEKVLGNNKGRLENEKALFEKTKQAAGMGAKVVVWNEGGALIYKNEEEEFLNKVKKMASENHIQIVAAYIVQTDPKKIQFENKLHWITDEGKSAWTYYKQFILPGEPAIYVKDKQKIQKTNQGVFSAAICYDFDNIKLTGSISKLNPGIVAIPASDWKGIDPFHTQMTSLRAIENGYSIIRSTRAAASAAFDPFGRVRAWMDYYENNDGIMIATVPNSPQNTIYKTIGDSFALLCLLCTFGIMGLSLYRPNQKIGISS